MNLIVERVNGSRRLPEFGNSILGGVAGDHKAQRILSNRFVAQLRASNCGDTYRHTVSFSAIVR
jgi:hypothetical protein